MTKFFYYRIISIKRNTSYLINLHIFATYTTLLTQNGEYSKIVYRKESQSDYKNDKKDKTAVK